MIFSCTDVDALTNCRSGFLGFLRWGFLRFYLFVILLFKSSRISLVSEQTSIFICLSIFSQSFTFSWEREICVTKRKTECICSTLTAINSDSDQITWPAPAPFTPTSLLQSLVIPPPPLQTTIAGCFCYSFPTLQPIALKYPHHYFSHQHYPPVNSRPSLLKSSPHKSNKSWTSFSFNPAQTRK